MTHICPFDGPVFGTMYVTNFKVVFENVADSKAARTTDVSPKDFPCACNTLNEIPPLVSPLLL